MEKYCPDAILADFVNPVPVLSCLVNNYTKIKCFGICEGYKNHMWDLSRILLGKDEEDPNFNVDVCGINHMSFILRGQYKEKDIFKMIDSTVYKNDWKIPKLSNFWNEIARKSIERGVYCMVEIYKKLGVLIFSNEVDGGMSHFFYDECLKYMLKNRKRKTKQELKQEIKEWEEKRKKEDEKFYSLINNEIDEKRRENMGKKLKNMAIKKDKNSIFVKIMKAISGTKQKIVASRPNYKAVKNFPERFVLEYSQIIEGKRIKPIENLHILEAVFGLVSSISTHQTLLADSIVQRDPKILYKALFAYPGKQSSTQNRKKLFKALLEINKDEIYPEFQKLKELL